MNRERQKEESLKRLQMLGLHEKDLKGVHVEGLFKLEPSEKFNKEVEEFEEETGNYVYLILANTFDFGRCCTYLIVSNDEEEWERDREELKEGYPFCYVKNISYPDFSEYGTCKIAIGKNGAFARIC